MTRFTKQILTTAIAINLLTVAAYAQQTMEQAMVIVDPVIRQPFTQTVPILGRLVAKQSGTVGSRIAGSVIEILAQVGDKVTRGQLIALIDNEPLKLQKKLALAQRAEAEARIATARALLALSSQEVKRMSSLQLSASVSQATIEDATQQQNIAFARVREAEVALTSSAASISLADLSLHYAKINAPFNGTVTAKLTEVGSYLQRGEAVIRLVSDKLLELEADIPANRLTGLTAGREIDISLDDGSRHTASVRAVVPEENPNTRTRRVRFHLDSETRQMALAVKQSVTLYIPAGVSRQINSVHKDAVVRKGSDNLVYVVENDVAKLKSIQTGDAIGDRLEVLQGLVVGDQVVVRGNERLQPDQPVIIAAQ
jgi:RND family efflux transporter MFP subunit